jgi:hypothetical protein
VDPDDLDWEAEAQKPSGMPLPDYVAEFRARLHAEHRLGLNMMVRHLACNAVAGQPIE